jgi:hypothetical protein
MNEPSLTQNERELVLQALSVIASDAHTIMHLCGAAIDAEATETKSSLMAAADKTAASVGMLADLVLGKMGEIGTRGSPENWLLSPSLQPLVMR